MTYDWFKSKFTAADLNGKTVAFKVPLEQGGIATGEGKLKAMEDARGWIRVGILHVQMTQKGAMANKIYVPIEAAEKIVRNPSGSECDFSFIAA